MRKVSRSLLIHNASGDDMASGGVSPYADLAFWFHNFQHSAPLYEPEVHKLPDLPGNVAAEVIRYLN